MYTFIKKFINLSIHSLKLSQLCLVTVSFLSITYFILSFFSVKFPKCLETFFNFIHDFIGIFYNSKSSPIDFTYIIATIVCLLIAGLFVYIITFLIDFEQAIDKIQKDASRRYEQRFNNNLEKVVKKVDDKCNQFALLYDIDIQRVAQNSYYENKVDTSIKIVEYKNLFKNFLTQNNFKMSIQQLSTGILIQFNNINDCDKVLNKIEEFIQKSKEDLKQARLKFSMNSAINLISPYDSVSSYGSKLQKLLNISKPNKTTVLSDFVYKYDKLTEKTFKPIAIGEYSFGNDTLDVYYMEKINPQ